jgi:hypothetical protein
MSEKFVFPGLSHTFREPLQAALRKIWFYLANVAIGPTWRLYKHDDGLYIQWWDPDAKYYKSRVLISSAGQVDAEGAINAAQSLDDVGRA